MKATTNVAHLWRPILFGAILVFAGCKKATMGGEFKYSPGSSSSDWTVSGQRTISRTHDGITRKLEAPSGVTIQDGKITAFPKAALIKIDESGSSEERHAELRENDGKLALWMQDKGTFRRGTPEEETWLGKFLDAVTST
jgi:hypothetical protein